MKIILTFFIAFILTFLLWPSYQHYYPCPQTSNPLLGQCVPLLERESFGGGTRFLYAVASPDYQVEDALISDSYQALKKTGATSYTTQFSFTLYKALTFSFIFGLFSACLVFLASRLRNNKAK